MVGEVVVKLVWKGVVPKFGVVAKEEEALA